MGGRFAQRIGAVTCFASVAAACAFTQTPVYGPLPPCPCSDGQIGPCSAYEWWDPDASYPDCHGAYCFNGQWVYGDMCPPGWWGPTSGIPVGPDCPKQCTFTLPLSSDSCYLAGDGTCCDPACVADAGPDGALEAGVGNDAAVDGDVPDGDADATPDAAGD